MTPKDAQQRVKKMLGPKACWRDNGRRTSPEQRAEASARAKAAREQLEAARKALDARRSEVLKQDAEYQRLNVAFREALATEKVSYNGGGYRIMAGVNMGFAWEVKAEGDNWAEVVRALESRTPNQLTSARIS